MEPSKKKPSSFGQIDLGYDPTSETMKHDSFFAEVAPGVANSGNLEHKWDVVGDHTISEEPPSRLKGD